MKLFVFLLNHVLDLRLGVLIPMLRAAAVADPDRDLGTAENIAFVGPLME
jgi:hypothetical protein